jgi:hypothetical protein
MNFPRHCSCCIALALLGTASGCKVDPLIEGNAEIKLPPEPLLPPAAEQAAPAPSTSPTPLTDLPTDNQALPESLTQPPGSNSAWQNIGREPRAPFKMLQGLPDITALINSDRPLIHTIDTFLSSALAQGSALSEALRSTIDPNEPGTSTEENEIIGGYGCGPGFSAIGALLYDGQVHCTGVVIAKRAVLTAAHCVTKKDAAKMRFTTYARPRDYRRNPGAIPSTYGIVGAECPTNFTTDDHPINGKGYRVYKDDLAIVYLDKDFRGIPMGLPTECGDGMSLPTFTYVGYGYANLHPIGNAQPASNFGLGKRRCVHMKPSLIDKAYIVHDTPGKNTCEADSGGPAFSYLNGQRIIIGIITRSAGEFCQMIGFSTRVDVHLRWITEKMKSLPTSSDVGTKLCVPTDSDSPANAADEAQGCEGIAR